MTSLVDFPIHIYCALCTQWLPLESLALLDSALCNKKRRKYFLEALVCDLASVEGHAFSFPSLTYLNWLIARNLSVRSLSLDVTFGDEEFKRIKATRLNVCCCELQSLRF